MKKRSLTLLEVMIAMAILGIMMTSIFQVLRQNLKMQIRSKEVKQIMMQRELFSHKIKLLLSVCEKSWIDTHPEAKGKVLRFDYERKIDPDFNFCGAVQAMLYLNATSQLCFVEWADKKEGRVEVLLDGVTQFECQLFDLKTTKWLQDAKEPLMVNMKITSNKETIPFYFFLKNSYNPIVYSTTPVT